MQEARDLFLQVNGVTGRAQVHRALEQQALNVRGQIVPSIDDSCTKACAAGWYQVTSTRAATISSGMRMERSQ